MNISIARRQKELKEELISGKKKTMVDVLIGWVSRGRPISTWTGTIIIFLLTTLTALIIIILLGQFTNLYQYGLTASPALVIWIFFNLITCTASMILSNLYFHSMVAVLRDQVIDKVDSNITLDEIKSWTDLASCKKPLLILALLFVGFISSIVLANLAGDLFGTLGQLGLIIILSVFLPQGVIFFGFILLSLRLSVRLRYFELSLFESDPANTEVIARLSNWFSSFVYLVAAYGALQTFGIVRSGFDTYYGLIPIFWTPIVAIFITSHFGLAKIIQRTKWKTQNSLQQKISVIQKKHAVPSNEERGTLLWLMDYHERVKATRNSALDLRSGVGFLNSMLLPLIAFVLGNIDIVLNLFSGKP